MMLLSARSLPTIRSQSMPDMQFVRWRDAHLAVWIGEAAKTKIA